MTMRDISVNESEDLPKVLEPLITDGAQAALGKPPQQAPQSNHEAQRKQMLQIVKLTAPGIKKLQVRCHLVGMYAWHVKVVLNPCNVMPFLPGLTLQHAHVQHS